MKVFNIAAILGTILIVSCVSKKNVVKEDKIKGHKIEVQIKGISDTTLLLGYHYGSKKLVADTIRVDSEGRGVFEGDTLLNPGMYMVLTPDLRFFEIIIDKDQVFKVTTDTSNSMFQNLKIEGSVDNQVFNEYQKRSSAVYLERKPIYDKMRYYYGIKDTMSLSPEQRKINRDSIEILKLELEGIKTSIRSYEDSIINKYPKALLSSVLNTMREIDVPDFPRNEKGEITDSLFKYTYMKKHYFDRVDFSDERLLRTPVYEMKIDQFFDRELIQIPDSIIPEVDKLMTRIIVDEKEGYEGTMYYTTLHHLFMKYQNPKYMGLDNIFVYIMGQYYVNNKMIPERVVNDSAYMAKVNERYHKMAKNKIGDVATDLMLYSKDYEWVSLNSIKADYIVLYFYDVDCGHCKKTIPEWERIYEKNNLQDKGVVNVYVYTQTEMEKWQKFIVDKKLEKGVHVFDPRQNTNFRESYDVYSTPVSYILDKDKKIIAKRLPPESLLDVLSNQIGEKFDASKPEGEEETDDHGGH